MSQKLHENPIISRLKVCDKPCDNKKKEENMREKIIERKFAQTVKSMGRICPKFTNPGFDGMPDRIVPMPCGKIGFVEVKRHGKKPQQRTDIAVALVITGIRIRQPCDCG